MIQETESVTDIEEAEGDVLIDFHATWCGPCAAMEPVVEDVAEDVDVLKVDVEEAPDVVREFGVRSVPTFVAVRGGEEVNRAVGTQQPNDLLDLFE
jgi:thioredoxin 1